MKFIVYTLCLIGVLFIVNLMNGIEPAMDNMPTLGFFILSLIGYITIADKINKIIYSKNKEQ